jgi:hypothetical protein
VYPRSFPKDNNNNIKYELIVGLNMPTVSISLSEKAYIIYTNVKKTNRSAIVSAALCQWNAQLMNNMTELIEE